MKVSYRIIARFACFKWKNYIILDFVVFVILISHRYETFSLTHVESTVHLYTTLVCELLVSKINDRESSFLGKHKTFFRTFFKCLRSGEADCFKPRCSRVWKF